MKSYRRRQSSGQDLFIHTAGLRRAYRLPWRHRIQQASNNKAFTAHLDMHRNKWAPNTHATLGHHPDRPIGRHGGEIKIAHFLSPHKEQINFRRRRRDVFPDAGLSRVRRSAPTASQREARVCLHASPENSYFCRGEFICASL